MIDMLAKYVTVSLVADKEPHVVIGARLIKLPIKQFYNNDTVVLDANDVAIRMSANDFARIGRLNEQFLIEFDKFREEVLRGERCINFCYCSSSH
jgi:hypothetical protein